MTFAHCYNKWKNAEASLGLSYTVLEGIRAYVIVRPLSTVQYTSVASVPQ